jgi:nucleoside-diphosphate-sugar epimerase
VRILITGGSGFLGGHFLRSLLEGGHEVVNLDLVEPPTDARTGRFVQGDIRDPDAVRLALAGCDALLHLAAAHHDFGIAPETFFSVNEEGARVLCRVADELGLRRICFFSSVAVYGSAPEPRDETTVPQPVTPYGTSKLAAERVFKTWVDSGGGRSCLVIRPTVIFGPNHFANLFTLIRQIDSRFFLQVGAGENVKSLSYIDNIVAATMYLWERLPAGAFEVYNYADHPDLKTRDTLAAIYRGLGRKAPRFYLPEPLAVLGALPFDLAIRATGRDLPVSGARIRKLCQQTRFEAAKIRRTGFQPAVSLPEGIARMVRWYLDRGRYEPARRHLPPPSLVSQAHLSRGRGGSNEE